MWKPPVSIIGCCLAALPLIGCAERFAALPPERPSAAEAYLATPARGSYAVSPMPSAILVFVPGTQTVGSDDLLTRDPSPWAAQGFGVVVMPDIAQLIADRRAALERLAISARALADAPIWLVGPGAAIEAAMPELPPGQVSGVVVTSVTSDAGSCSRTVFYSNRGTGAEPRVTVKSSGDACGASPPVGERPAPLGVTPVPRVRPGAPRIIEAAIPAQTSPAAQRPLIRHVAEEIKGLPSS